MPNEAGADCNGTGFAGQIIRQGVIRESVVELMMHARR